MVWCRRTCRGSGTGQTSVWMDRRAILPPPRLRAAHVVTAWITGHRAGQVRIYVRYLSPMNADLPTGSMHRRSQWRMAVAGVVGVVAGVLVPVPSGSQGWPFHVVVGYAVGAGLFSISALVHIMRMNADQTRRHVNGLGGDRTEVDLVVFVGSFAALAAIGFMLFAGGKKTSSGTAIEAVASLVAVAAAWLSIHTAYALRYAKHYYNVEPGCIDFNTKEPRSSATLPICPSTWG